ncbi:MAG: hypothetical protein ACM3PV_04785 [Betaproteobacteria bacterium]
MTALLEAPITVSLDRLFLDPNNPRLAREQRPGYAHPEVFMTPEEQAELQQQLRHRYRLSGLVSTILTVGWLPVDAILVWEPPALPGRYLVVEGNTRVVALRTIRKAWQEETARLLRAQARGDARAEALAARKLARAEAVVRASERLDVQPVRAASPAELAERLPRLLGVRHLSHAQNWRAPAVNLYLLALYREAFAEAHGEEPLRLDDELLARVAESTAVSVWRARRGVQTASGFLHFKARYAERLPTGESFVEEDQGFLARLFEPGHARDRFGVGERDLALPPAGEEALFAWAFRLPRGQGDGSQNRNVWRSPDDVALWSRLARYDEEHHTAFAGWLDPERPEAARPMAEVELEYLTHRGHQSPVDALRGLLDTLRRVQVDTLRARRDELRPLVAELLRLGHDLSGMLGVID